VLRALALALTASAGSELALEEIQSAFVERSRRLVSADFIEDYLGRRGSALDEARGLIWLADNIAGGVNKRAAARWLSACVGGLRFEREVRTGPDAPTAKLETLATLQRGVLKAGLTDADGQAALRRLGEVGGWVEADARLTTAVARAEAPAAHRLTLLCGWRLARRDPRDLPPTGRGSKRTGCCARTPCAPNSPPTPRGWRACGRCWMASRSRPESDTPPSSGTTGVRSAFPSQIRKPHGPESRHRGPA
jgi:hypothetical protein